MYNTHKENTMNDSTNTTSTNTYNNTTNNNNDNNNCVNHKLICSGDLYTLSQGFVWISIIVLNQLA